jgi:transcriptional regulator with XRE-family HTH domain
MSKKLGKGFKTPNEAAISEISLMLSTRRSELGITQQELANRLDVTCAYISQVENGLGISNIEYLTRYCKALDLDVKLVLSKIGGNEFSSVKL